MPVSFKDILEALEFVSADGMGEHQAFLCKQSGRVYWHSEFSDELGELETRFEEDDASSISPATQMAQARLPLRN